jgi:HEAT repeat protein
MLLSLSLAGFLFTSAAPARAAGLVITSKDLKVADRTALQTGIAKARAKHPAAFQRVAKAPQLARELDQQKRGRAATITLPLKAIGPEGLFPMLEMLALQAPKRGDLNDSAWTTLRVGLLEAVGELRDARSKPVLLAVISQEKKFEILRAAVEALGKLGDDDSTTRLVTLAKKPGTTQLAVLAGIGECRRSVVAKELARQSTTNDEAKLRVVVDSLSDVGNSWAWKTPAVAKVKEENEVRGIAATALVNVFVKRSGYVRDKAARALLVVDHPHTPKLLHVARAHADPRTQKHIDDLLQKLANNPVR